MQIEPAIVNSRTPLAGTRSMTRGRPDGSRLVESTPEGLFRAKYSNRAVGSASPSTRICWTAGSTRVPNSVTTRRSTSTRPAVISSSHCRRLPSPAAAKTFWRRCNPPPGDCPIFVSTKMGLSPLAAWNGSGLIPVVGPALRRWNVG